MQPASCRPAIATARGTRTSGRPRRSFRTGNDRFDNLTLLKGDGRLQDNHLLSLQARLDIERLAKVATDLDALKVDGVIRPDDRHAAALRVEDDRGRRHAPPSAGWRRLAGDVDEHAGQEVTRRGW